MQLQRNEGRKALSDFNSAPSTDVLRTLEDYSDISAWLNDIIDDNDDAEGEETSQHIHDLSELERRVSQLSAIVEVACEETSAQLEKTIDEVSRTIPRLTYDLQLMHESAMSLQGSLHAVEQHSQSTLNSSETVPVLERLQFLDTVKRNMEASLSVLREAEAWSSLESEVVSYLGEQAYAKAATRLSEASKSLGVFQNTPEFESRKTLLTNLQNQLEAALSSALVSGINNNDVDACKKYFDIFCHIEREAEFRSYWYGSKRKGLVSFWKDTPLRDGDEEKPVQSTDRKFSTFVAEYYNELLSVLQIERPSVMLIFPDPQPTLSAFIINTLSSLHPSPSQRLGTIVTRYGDLALPELISVFKATEEFAVTADKIMEKVGFSALSPSVFPTSLDEKEGSSLQRTHSRRRSQRQSFSRRLSRMSVSGTGTSLIPSQTGAPSLDHGWDEALFEPFLAYQADYATLEKRLLRAQLNSLIASPTSSTGARLLRERAVDIFSFADDSLTRCMTFTHGYGAVGLLEALDSLFNSFLESTSRDILNSKSNSLSDGNAITSGEEFSELDYSPEDLATFQLVLHLLEAARAVLERLAVFESKLRTSLAQISNSQRMSRNDPFGLYISGTTRGEISLLQGSSLNSIELQSLLDDVDPERQPQLHGQTPFTPISAGLSNQKPHPGQTRESILVGARAAISKFANSCQIRLQTTILAPLLKHLSTYRTLPSWTSLEPTRESRGGGAVSEVVMPSFSLSPSATIQRVAEGLLSLPRLFEVYADDDALAFSIETLPFVNEDILNAMLAESASAASVDEGSGHDILDPSRPRPRHLPSPSLSVKILPPIQSSAPISLLTPEAVSSAWLASLALTLLSHLTNDILPAFSPLTTSGAAQLAEDLGYLSQIVKALNVEWEELEIWRECIGLEKEELRKRTVQAANGEDVAKPTALNVMRYIARLRGLV